MSSRLSDGIELLAELGIGIRVEGPGVVLLRDDEQARRLRLISRSTPPTPSAWAAVAPSTNDREITAFVVQRSNASSIDTARADARFALIAIDDGLVVLGGRLYSRSAAASARHTSYRRMPWGRFALLRALARTTMPRTQNELATESGITQAAVSLALRQMPEQVERTPDGWRSNDRVALWNRFLDEYPGPRGIVEHWFSSAPIIAQSDSVVAAVPGVLRSGDSAADALAPWRAPRRAVLYAATGADLARMSFAESGSTEATLQFVVPADPTIVATARAWDPTGTFVDPLIAAWDLMRSGGADAAEAAAKLRQRFLTGSGS